MPSLVSDPSADAIVDRGAIADAELRSLECGLEELMRHPGQQEVALVGSDGRVRVKVPTGALEVFEVLVNKLVSQGRVGIVGIADELSTQEAADLLNVSRQYVVRLMDEGRLKHHMTGSHRRALARDVLEFKRERDLRRRSALQRMISLSEEAGAYDAERERS